MIRKRVDTGHGSTNGRNILSILIQRTRTDDEIERNFAYIESEFFEQLNIEIRFDETTAHYDTVDSLKKYENSPTT